VCIPVTMAVLPLSGGMESWSMLREVMMLGWGRLSQVRESFVTMGASMSVVHIVPLGVWSPSSSLSKTRAQGIPGTRWENPRFTQSPRHVVEFTTGTAASVLYTEMPTETTLERT
jgi:hypothetical protein